ncbi:MAG TPA: BTAD domain-containing putative transcriptional regulator [Candidatus Limnocylindrales bacterium]
MEFLLLGPVEVLESSAPVPLGGAKPKALLAALLLERGRVVPIMRLIDVLWGDSPPRTARDVIQTYVKSLRRTFAERGHDDVIVTQPPGYLVRVAPTDVDVHVFTDLLSRARQSGDPGNVAELLRQALELWRGPALAGMDYTLLAGEAARLEEMRLRAIEERISAEQTLGRYEELAPELTTLVAEHPTNERLRSQLMVTLYQLGRQSDALALYREGRQALIEELGVEPGAELTSTHEAILRNDLHWRPISSTVEAAIPSQLPWVPAEFVGRSGETAALLRGLPSRPQVIAGAGGTGKTTLAVHVAGKLAASYPDGQLYAHLDGMSQVPAAANEVLGRFLRALGMADARLPDSLQERANLFRTRISGRRVLILLDDARDEGQVRPLLPGGQTCGVIITSRSRLSGLGTSLIELDVMPHDDALNLLAQLAGDERADVDPASAERIVDYCGQLPLALRIAAARLTSRKNLPLRWLADRLADESQRLSELAAGDLAVRASIQLSFDSLTSVQQTSLCRLGFLSVPEFGSYIVSWLIDGSSADGETTAEVLVDSQLVEFLGVDDLGISRYRLHDLVRLYARERAEQDQERDALLAAVARVIQGWLSLTERTAELIAGEVEWQHAFADISGWFTASPTDPRAWFEREQFALVPGLERAAALGMHELVSAFGAERLWTFFIGAGRFDLRNRMIDVILASARHNEDARGQAIMLANLGQLHYMRDRYAPARLSLTEALEKFREIGDALRELATLAGLASACRESGRLKESLHFLGQASALLTMSGDPPSVGYIKRLSGSVRLELGEFELALSDLEEALDAYRRIETQRGEGLVLRTLGLYYRATGNLPQALAHCRRARAAFQAVGDEWLEAYAIRAQAKTLVRLERGDELLPELERALSVCQQRDDRWGQGATLRVLGELHLAAGRWDLCDTFLQAAARIWEDIEAPLWMARTRLSLSRLYQARGQSAQATSALETALATFRTHGAREYRELGGDDRPIP